MHRWHRIRCLLLLCSLIVLQQPIHADVIPVIDAANLLENVVSAVYAVLSVANEILELTPLDEIVLSGEFEADLGAIAEIIHEANGLAYDLASLQIQVQQLFSLESAPGSAAELRVRLQQIRQLVFLSYSYAMRTQTLLRTTQSTIQHITRLASKISGFVGNMQGNQTTSQMDGKLTQVLTQLEVQTQAYQRAQSVERIAEPMTIESLNKINEALMADHPK